MATISIRIKAAELEELNKQSRTLHIPRAEYVRQAVIAKNKLVDLELRKKRIMEASQRVRKESMKVNAEFDAIEDTSDV